MPGVGVVELSSVELAAHDDQRDLGAAGHADLVRALRRVLPSRPLVLDAGGGSGTAVPALHEAGARVVLVDWSPTMLHAAGKYAAVRITADLTRLPFASASFDAVHAAYALQNLSDWRAGLTECARVLRPGGALVVAWGGPPADERLGALEGAYFAAVEDYVGVRAERSGLTLTAAHDVLAAHGCSLQEVVEVRGGQARTPRQVIERVALNPYRAQPPPAQRRQAVRQVLDWAAAHVGPVDGVLDLVQRRTLHIYKTSSGVRK